MTQDHDPRSDSSPEMPPRDAGEGVGVNASRRRFTRAGLSSSVIMTLASRPVLASQCSVSGKMSGDGSRPHMVTCMGNTPGYWKNHPEAWLAYGFEPGLPNPIAANNNGQANDYDYVQFGPFIAAKDAIENKSAIYGGNNLFEEYLLWGWGLTPVDLNDQNKVPADNDWATPAMEPTSFDFMLSGSGLSADAGSTNPNGLPLSAMQALWDPKDALAEPATLASHAVAAVLNTFKYPVGSDPEFGYTLAGLKEFISENLHRMGWLKDRLDELNNAPGTP